MPKPFDGLTFCCTGIEANRRHELEKSIRALGGTFYVDLMSSVHYLVVGNRKSAKYRYCITYRHDVSFVTEDAIDDIHSRWTNGDDASLDINRHLLPTFANFTVCVARVQRPPQDEYDRLFSERFRSPPPPSRPAIMLEDAFSTEDIVSTMVKLGANVSSILTRGCTVLIGTDTSGKRYTTAKEWGIPVVHPMWVYDSCLRGAAFRLEDYELTPGVINNFSNSCFAWKQLYLSRLSPSVQSNIANRRSKPNLKKTSDVWTSIMSSTHVSTAKEARDDSWNNDDPESGSEPGDENDSLNLLEKVASGPENTSTLFSGIKFLALGLSISQQNLLRNVVVSHSGELAISAEDEDISHILVLVKNAPQISLMLSMLPPSLKRRLNNNEIHVVTDWFVERSLFYNKVCRDSWCKPLQGLVPSLSVYKICISGFTGIELLHIEKLIGYLNLEYCPVFNSKRDLLIVNINLFKDTLKRTSPQLFDYKHKDILGCPIYSNGNESKSVSVISSKNKINAAKKWNIPVVSIAYLWEMIEVSAGQPNLQMPDFSNLSWCLFAPETHLRSGSLAQVMKSVNSSSSAEGVITEGSNDVEDSVQLPSPRKSKDKQKYGHLVGKGQSLAEKLATAQNDNASSETNKEYVSETVTDTEITSTQVGYANIESIRGDSELLKKLEGGSEQSKKRRRRGE